MSQLTPLIRRVKFVPVVNLWLHPSNTNCYFFTGKRFEALNDFNEKHKRS